MDHGEDIPLFVEIRQSSKVVSKPYRIEVWISVVAPQKCKALLKDLSKQAKYKDEALAHLKRVRRSPVSQGESPPKKKAKIELQVLLGRDQKEFDTLVSIYQLAPQLSLVPGRSAESKQELDEFNQIWPTIFFQKNSEEHKEQELALSVEELMQMEHGMQLAMEDEGGAVILNPETGAAVSMSQKEQALQYDAALVNPLCTPVLLAIQGVSRIEREAALGHGMDSDVFRNGQYLCTGFDVYLRKEPNVFEAMALVHSRVRRVVFGVINAEDGGIGGTGEASAVHCLPGTNHRYRAFACSSKSRYHVYACTKCSQNNVQNDL